MDTSFLKNQRGYVDIRSETCQTINFDVKNKKLGKFSDVIREGNFYRVAGEGGFLSSSKMIDFVTSENTFSRFVKRFYAEQEENGLPIKTTPIHNKPNIKQFQNIMVDISDPEISFSFISEIRSLIWKNSLGKERQRFDQVNLLKIFAKKRSKNGMIQLRHFFRTEKPEDILQQVEILKKTLQDLKDPQILTPRQMDVVLHPSVASLLFHEIFGHYAEMDRWSPYLRPPIGKKVADSSVTLEDIPNDPIAGVTLPFDDEGILTTDLKLIDEGIFVNALHTLESAFRTKFRPNGRGRARDFRFPARSRMTNLKLAPGKMEVQELIEQVKDGIYLVGSYGGVFSTLEFQICCQYGYRIQNGKIGEPVLQPIMNGTILNALSKVVGISKDFTWVMDGGCLAEEQFLITSGRGAPHVLMKNVDIS